MATASSFVYSLSRPLHPMQAQTQQYQQLEEYAYKNEIQAILHDTLSKLFKAQPEDPLAFIIDELQAQKQLRDGTSGEATAATAEVPSDAVTTSTGLPTTATDRTSEGTLSSGEPAVDAPQTKNPTADVPVPVAHSPDEVTSDSPLESD
eukprot:jgi/Ulvmu1/5026/UM021_0043.1